MALKFLNKKGWHTGSLRNIENVWKAEQKHDAEQKKLEELRKQIHEEREKSEFRQIQEAAGLVPRQERLDFLYESGLAVGKGSSEGFKALQDQPSGGVSSSAPESSSSKAVVPGALFEDKPQSANDAWRKLHSDPLLLIRQREQEALARIKNNPIRMAMIRKSVETEKKQEDKKHKKKRSKHKHDQIKSKDEDPPESQSDYREHEDLRNIGKRDKRKVNNVSVEHEKVIEKHERHSSIHRSHSNHSNAYHERRNVSEEHQKLIEKHERQSSIHRSHSNHSNAYTERHEYKHSDHSNYSSKDRSGEKYAGQRNGDNSTTAYPSSDHERRRGVPKMTEEEREARLREMQVDAEVHEGQRWKRLRKASEADALEASHASNLRGKNFLDATKKSVYGMEKGGSATIEESVRRRTFYSQGKSEHESNAFRR